MSDDRVHDLIQPVHALQRKARADDLGVLFVDLRPVNVEHDGQDEDERPVEVFRASDPNAVHKIHSSL